MGMCQQLLYFYPIDVIEELLEKMSHEELQLSVTKRHLLTERLVSQDLVPLVKFASPDINELPLVLRWVTTPSPSLYIISVCIRFFSLLHLK